MTVMLSSFCALGLLIPPLAEGAQARNVILFIGDGMGPEQIKAARYYSGAPLSFESLPYQAQCTTYSANNAITDSAAAGTAIATGVKVNNYVVSKALPGGGQDLVTTLEKSKAAGKRVGLITTTYLTHATPATFGAHAADRNSTAEIGSDYLSGSKPHLLFGGGGNGLSVTATAAAGYSVATDIASFAQLDPAAPFVSAQFGSSYLPYEYDYPWQNYPFPHLSEMVDKALTILGQQPEGFFLMVEGGMIDQACHANHLNRSVHETLELSRAVKAALDWAANRSDTLIIVTADHETGGLSVSDNGAGSYPAATWSTTGHTGVNVPAFAWGPGAEAVTGTLDNTDIHWICMGQPRPVPATVVATGSLWKYEATGTDLGESWKAPAYDDSTWPAGFAQLGYGDADEQTVIPKSAVYPCYYFRHTFQVNEPASYSDLSLRILRDDGAVIYLNGIEVARYGMPSGPVSFGTWASSAADYPWDPAISIPNYLVPGQNVLAVEIHQCNSTSTDISLDVELTAQLSEPDNTPPVISAVGVGDGDVTDRSAVVTWVTDEPASSRVECYDGGAEPVVASSPTLVNQHSVLITGLHANTPYTFKVFSADAHGNEASAYGIGFTTAMENLPPVADGLEVTTTEDTAANVILSGSDEEGAVLSFRIVQAPMNGTLTGTAPNLVYTPNLNFFGGDSFAYVANDGIQDSSAVAVTIAVSAVNDPPSSPDILSTAAGDKSVTLTWSPSSDPEGDGVSYGVYRREPGTSYVLIAGNLAVTTFAENNLQNGTTYEYIVRASDGVAYSDSGVATAVPAAPDYNAYVIENPTVTYGSLSGDSAATMVWDDLAQIVTETKVGTGAKLEVGYVLQTIAEPSQVTGLTLRFVGSYTDANDVLRTYIWNGADWQEVTVTVTDNGWYAPLNPASCLDAEGRIQVRFTDSASIRKEQFGQLEIDLLYAEVVVNGSEPVNQEPVAENDTASTTSGVPVKIAVLANDRDPENEQLLVSVVTSPLSGDALINPDGTITYTPWQGFSGDDTFTYTVSDGFGGEATATVIVNVDPVTSGRTVSVASIDLSLIPSGKNWKANAQLKLIDDSSAGAAGATVTGKWLFEGNDIQAGVVATSDAQGVAQFSSPPVKASSGSFTFVVTDVSLAGATYLSGQVQGSVALP